MQSKATTAKEYLAELPADRREALERVRAVILKNLDKDYEEGVQYGMIGYYVPHRIFPPGYHCDPKQPLPFAALASQKNYMSIYLMAHYGSEKEMAWLQSAWAKAGKKLDMGKSCIRFKNVNELALDVLGEAIRRVPAKGFIAAYQAVRAATGAKPAAQKAADSEKANKTVTQAPAKPAKETGVKKTSEKTVKKTSVKSAKPVVKKAPAKTPKPAAKKPVKKPAKKSS